MPERSDTLSAGRASAHAKWHALVGDLRQCVTCNLLIALELALAHAEDLRGAVFIDEKTVGVDFGVLVITAPWPAAAPRVAGQQGYIAGEITVEALGEEVFALDDGEPITGRCLWGAWLVTRQRS